MRACGAGGYQLVWTQYDLTQMLNGCEIRSLYGNAYYSETYPEKARREQNAPLCAAQTPARRGQSIQLPSQDTDTAWIRDAQKHRLCAHHEGRPLLHTGHLRAFLDTNTAEDNDPDRLQEQQGRISDVHEEQTAVPQHGRLPLRQDTSRRARRGRGRA